MATRTGSRVKKKLQVLLSLKLFYIESSIVTGRVGTSLHRNSEDRYRIVGTSTLCVFLVALQTLNVVYLRRYRIRIIYLAYLCTKFPSKLPTDLILSSFIYLEAPASFWCVIFVE